jgi:hypothetical protein
MDQRKFAEYVLINPLITSWGGDQYDYSQGSGIMQNNMTIAYETVKFYSGALGRAQSGGDPNVQGFATDAHYDKTVSPIARPGANATVFGQGGLLDAGAGILGDLQSGSVWAILVLHKKLPDSAKHSKAKILAVLQPVKQWLGHRNTQTRPARCRRQVANKANGWLFPHPRLRHRLHHWSRGRQRRQPILGRPELNHEHCKLYQPQQRSHSETV